jgi:putative membrane-bound dehydrogenase-like protein
MKSTAKCSALTSGASAVLFVFLAVSDKAATSTEQVLTVPAGFSIERVAGPPLVNRPIVADFDEDGRLYVADSSGSNDKVEKQLADKPHRIVRLEDKNGDGRFDSSVVFADKMMFPEGAMWFDGSLYVAAPPSIWKLTDTDGDGVADRRDEWFRGKTLTSCANDLHGPYLGPDGWIYWTKGAFAQQTYERPGKTPLVTRASHIFRRRPADDVIEPVMTGGMDNPVDVAFTPAGERVLTATFVEHPQLDRRDALIHAIYGGLYGKPHAVIEPHKRTGTLMPVLTHLGAAAPSGLTRYSSRAFGEGYRDNFFAALFNLQKVTRHVLEPNGATFTSHDSDFVVSNSRDFHPTDVVEDADGSLLVLDTGAWYKLCCPTSQLAAPEVLGAIYRVRRQGAARPDDPRGRNLAWRAMSPPDLARLLDDVRPSVVNRAMQELAALASGAVSVLDDVLKTSAFAPSAVRRDRPSADARRNAVWALTRIPTTAARESVRFALNDPDQSVRLSAVHSSAVWRDTAALPRLVDVLKSDRPPVQRAAAEALGRLGDRKAVADLLALAGSGLDRTLEHSVTYALIEIADPSATAAGLQAASSRSRRVALIALDQMEGGGLKAEAVIPLLDSSDPVLKETAWWIAGHRPEWGSALAGFFQERLAATNVTPAAREDLQQKLVQFAENPAVQDLLAAMAEGNDRLVALSAMARTRANELPSRWIAPLVRALAGREIEVTRGAISVARAAQPPKDAAGDLHAALLGVARNTAWPLDVRIDALAALSGGLTRVDQDLFDLLRSGLEPAQPISIRVAAAAVVERAPLERKQLLDLTGPLANAGPLELPRLLPAFDRGSDEALGLAMLAGLQQSKSLASIRPDILRPRLAKYPESVQQKGELLLAGLNADAARQQRRLEELLAAGNDGPAGDVRRGQAVFNSTKAACLSCHTIGYLGGRIGPDLTRIGQIRSERDLLEAILFPSASFARGYESVVVTTASGATHGGVLRSDLTDTVVLVNGAGEEIRILRREIVDMQPGTVSVMPSGLATQLSRQELTDLLAFLKATRSGAD